MGWVPGFFYQGYDRGHEAFVGRLTPVGNQLPRRIDEIDPRIRERFACVDEKKKLQM